MDNRHKLKLLWSSKEAPSQTAAMSMSPSERQEESSTLSLWDPPTDAATTATPGCEASSATTHSTLPAAEVAVTLDPATVRFSAVQDGGVLVVEQQHRPRRRSAQEGKPLP